MTLTLPCSLSPSLPPSIPQIGRRTTKRLLVYGKRDFIFASFEEKESSSSAAAAAAAAANGNKKTKNGQKKQGGREGGKKGEHFHVTASISLSLEGVREIGGHHTFLPPSFPPSLLEEREGYTRAHQDLVGFYFPCPEDAFAAHATIVMRTGREKGREGGREGGKEGGREGGIFSVFVCHRRGFRSQTHTHIHIHIHIHIHTNIHTYIHTHRFERQHPTLGVE